MAANARKAAGVAAPGGSAGALQGARASGADLPGGARGRATAAVGGVAGRVHAEGAALDGAAGRAFDAGDASFRLCGNATGFREDYSHNRLVLSRNASLELWPLIADWMAQR